VFCGFQQRCHPSRCLPPQDCCLHGRSSKARQGPLSAEHQPLSVLQPDVPHLQMLLPWSSSAPAGVQLEPWISGQTETCLQCLVDAGCSSTCCERFCTGAGLQEEAVYSSSSTCRRSAQGSLPQCATFQVFNSTSRQPKMRQPRLVAHCRHS